MNKSFFNSRSSLCASLFGLFFLISCASNTPEVNTSPSQETSESSETPSYYEDESPSMDYTSEETPAPKATGGTIETSGYTFTAPDNGWTIIGGEDNAPY
ncbi:MAG: hypothetical protein IKS96_13215, partial [Fibrobacter sp.]|nr:hypothetical protein [Fibrobacter sp.]